MLRKGGWAVPLRCDNPTLVRWLHLLEEFSQFLGLPYDSQVPHAQLCQCLAM